MTTHTALDLRMATIGQIAIPIHDLARSTAFYRDSLGLQLLFEVDGRMSFFDCGGVRLMLSLPEAEFDHRASVVYFRVSDLDAVYETLKTRGVVFRDTPHKLADMGSYELWMAFFEDAEGTVLALMSERPK